MNPLFLQTEDSCQGGAGLVAKRLRVQSSQRRRTRATYPSCQHLAAKLCNLLGKITRKLVIAATQTVVVVASVRALGLLLCAQRRHAHFAMIGSIEAFDISNDPAALFHRHLLAIKILREA